MSTPNNETDLADGCSSSLRERGEEGCFKLPEPPEFPKRRDPDGGGGAVRFRSVGSIEAVRRISRVSDYDLEEITNYWGDDDECKLRKHELKQAAKDMECHRRLSDNLEFTTLGIADMTGEAKAFKRANRVKARHAVMDEQELQEREGVVDDELLADVYSDECVFARRRAAEKAKTLHEEVEHFS